MKKQETQEIKTIYSDALYWSMSPMSRDKKYHLTRLNESILRKLIHYDKKNKKITFSNQWISKHVFLDITQIEKAIPHLEKKGFINCITYSKKDKNGKLIKQRIINVNWDFIQHVLSEVPEMKFTEKENDGAEQKTNESDGKIEALQEDNNKKEAVEIEAKTPSTNVDFNVQEYLTKRKVEFAKNELIEKFNYDNFLTANKETLDKYFYQNENVWYIKTIANNNEDLWENIHGVNLRYTGTGSRFNLFTIDKNDKETDSFQLNWSDFDNYLESKNIKFGDITLDNYETLRQFEKKPLNL
jgi:hypothetical protein